MGVFNLRTITKYVAAVVYAASGIVYLDVGSAGTQKNARNVLGVAFGPAWAIAVCGLLVNNVYYKELAKRDRTTLLGRRVGDVFGHALPAAVATALGPKALPVSLPTYSLVLLCIYALALPMLERVYVGVPTWVLWGLAPFTMLAATYLRYYPSQ